MEMDGLMKKLEDMLASEHVKDTEWVNQRNRGCGRVQAIRQVQTHIQQHLDHAEEIQAQEDAAAREQEQVPIGTKVYLSAGVIESGDPGYLRRGHDVYFLSAMPSTVHTRDDFSHLDDDGEPGVTDGGVPASG